MEHEHNHRLVDIKGMTIPELREFVKRMDQPAYRATQIFYWMYNRAVTHFDSMTDCTRALRGKLAEVARIGSIELLRTRVSEIDGTTKYLFRLSDGLMIESVLIPQSRVHADGRLTLCISTQVGCPLHCIFCATGSMGFARNLTAGEIVDQVLSVRRLSPVKITNLVIMGMGEPLLNYENVMKAIEIISHERSAGISAKKTTLSTAGYVEYIRRMADEGRKCKLAISLHSVDNTVRTMLMPLTRKHPVEDILAAAEYYYKKTKQRITYEYLMLKGINDRDEDLRGLVRYIRRVPSKINLIPFHAIDFVHPVGTALSLQPSSQDQIEEFARKLREAGITVMVRNSAGEDIEAACGQLAAGEKNHPKINTLPLDFVT
jgi:23S rRNA (adenine2503-C2)-methyltransferase